MAILSSKTIEQITNAVKTARIFGIESFIIEPSRVRGIDEAFTVAIYDDKVSLDLECSIGINRLDVLVNRLMLFDGRPDFKIDCVVDERSGEAQSLVMKANRAKAEYRCAKIKAIQAPKSLDVPREYMMDIGEDIVNMISRADTAMKAETINIICDDSVITYEFVDGNGDVFNYEGGNLMVNLKDDSLVNLSYRYPVKLVMLALKHNTTGNFYITHKGMMNTEVNGVNIFIPSKQ